MSKLKTKTQKLKIYIGADHKGFHLKEKIAKWLYEWGYKFEDMGADHLDLEDDYTLYAERVASMVKETPCTLGILLCGSGVGADVTANKFDGVRAGIGIDAKQVREGREDDDMNILVIAADFTKDDEAKKMLKVFLETEFSGKARFKRRLQDIEKIEANN